MRLYPEHPILHDFKHETYNFDLTMVWPYGAGGHFLLNSLTRSNSTISQLNEYGNPTEIWNNIDHDSFSTIDDDELTMSDCLATAYNTAKTSNLSTQYYDFKNQNSRCILAGHRLPVLFSKVYDYHTDELITISVNSETAWITKVLAGIKHKFAQTMNVYSIVDIVNTYYYSKLNTRIIVENIINVANTIQPYIPDYDVSNTQLVFEYYFWLTRQNLKISIETFKQYVYSDFVCTVYKDEMYTIDSIQSVSKYANNTYIIDYIDLFFKYDVPDKCSLSAIDKLLIKQYSIENLKLLEMLVNLLPADKQFEKHKMLAYLHSIL